MLYVKLIGLKTAHFITDSLQFQLSRKFLTFVLRTKLLSAWMKMSRCREMLDVAVKNEIFKRNIQICSN